MFDWLAGYREQIPFNFEVSPACPMGILDNRNIAFIPVLMI